jgi:hypothetical protein
MGPAPVEASVWPFHSGSYAKVVKPYGVRDLTTRLNPSPLEAADLAVVRAPHEVATLAVVVVGAGAVLQQFAAALVGAEDVADRVEGEDLVAERAPRPPATASQGKHLKRFIRAIQGKN